MRCLRFLRLLRILGVCDGVAGGEGLLLGVLAGKADVVARMEVARSDLQREGQVEELVDGWRDVAAAWDCERAIWRAEIVLPTRGHESERRGCGWVR